MFTSPHFKVTKVLLSFNKICLLLKKLEELENKKPLHKKEPNLTARESGYYSISTLPVVAIWLLLTTPHIFAVALERKHSLFFRWEEHFPFF